MVALDRLTAWSKLGDRVAVCLVPWCQRNECLLIKVAAAAPGVPMKASRYNIASEDPATGRLVLFNTLYGSTAVVPPEEACAVVAALEDPCTAASISAELVAQLSLQRFVVDSDLDELALVLRRKEAGVRDRNRLDVIIMPNLDCNFACPYCYENHNRANHMSNEVRDRLIKWLASTIPQHKVLLLNWFGGEPLLSPDHIETITGFARSQCDEHGVRLLTNITTNGYALTAGMIARLIALEIFSYQITVDGPAITHNQTRVLKTGKGTFDRVFRNIINLARADTRVRISVRVNYNHQNILEIPKLLALFPADVRKQLRVVFEPVFGDAKLSATENIDGAEISRRITEYYEQAQSLGYDVRLGGLGVGRLVYCYAERESQYIVDFKGDVFKCSVTDFSPDERIGWIDADGLFVGDVAKAKEWSGAGLIDEKCSECTFLPLCMGGCRKDRIANGDTGSYCHLVPTNTSQVLKSIAFGSFGTFLNKEAQTQKGCAQGSQQCEGRGC